jgi:hypothetical protein
MEFVNSSPFPALFSTGSMGDREMLGTVTTKVTFALDKGWLIPVEKDQMWPIFEEPFVYNNQTLGIETDFRRTLTDLVVFGNAKTPNQTPLNKMAVGIQSSEKTLMGRWVFGHRFWLKSGKSLYATEPRLFTEMPLTNEYAFGGKTSWDGTELTHPLNPDGRGFHLKMEEALEKPLPNIELPNALIQNWNDQPLPACLYKTVAPMEMANVDVSDQNGLIKIMFQHNFQSAISELRLSPKDLGKWLRLIGFAHSGDIYYPIPPLEAPVVRVSIGDLASRFPATLSGVVILADEGILIATYQAKFRYLMRPMEKRHAELRWKGDTSVRLSK